MSLEWYFFLCGIAINVGIATSSAYVIYFPEWRALAWLLLVARNPSQDQIKAVFRNIIGTFADADVEMSEDNGPPLSVTVKITDRQTKTK